VQKDESFLSVSGAGTLSFKSFSTNSGVPCLNQKCSEIPNTSSGPLCQGFGFLQNGEANKVHFVASGSRQKQLRFFFLDFGFTSRFACAPLAHEEGEKIKTREHFFAASETSLIHISYELPLQPGGMALLAATLHLLGYLDVDEGLVMSWWLTSRRRLPKPRYFFSFLWASSCEKNATSGRSTLWPPLLLGWCL
jgi:hypothetical protein